MLTSKVAKRYAQGLLEFTKDTGNMSETFSEMQDLVKILKESKDLNQFFQSPFINYKKKTENKELERTQKSLFVTDKQRGFKKRNEIVVGRERETYLCLRDEIAECKTV